MEVKVLNERRNELSDGLSVWYEFEYMGNIGEYSVNEYKSENNVVHFIFIII